MAWKRLIRFVDDNGVEQFGDPCIDSADELYEQLEAGTLHAVAYSGSTSPTGPLVAGERTHVKSLSDLLRPTDVPIIRCIGLNYMKHIKEGGRTPPPYPSVFIKPSTSVAGHDEDVPIPKVAQDGTIDYEGELAVVIGDRPVKNLGEDVSDEEVLSYIAGYMVSNDVSARAWQRDPKKAGGVPQWCFSKGFDKYAPLGPMLVSGAALKPVDGVSATAVAAASQLTLQTFVNGEERQNTSTSDLLFGVIPILRFCSQGTTLLPGTVILTGTPSGVAMGMNPPRYLDNGDVVEVRISELGRVRNKMVFE
ncbi:hypothetical protein SEUCBS140593_010702 [Sporothrix eucalyptigena]|uniref:Fumarylacetoacetase-like C-terminal domain-containing protein n=1 Tax=Sporothrix eucalyptigena TaxID=1812306 RepID=A0ABP0D209_9PEZI